MLIFYTWQRYVAKYTTKYYRRKNGFQSNEGSSFTQMEIKNEFKNQEVICLLQNFINKHLEGQKTSRITKMFESNNQFLVSTNSFIVKIKNVTIILIMYGFIY